MENDKSIEFASELLGNSPQKLKVLYSDSGVLALEKPAGVLIDAFPWFPEPPSIVAALKSECLHNPDDLAEYHLSNIYSVYTLEPEVTGVALLATSKESSAYLRNELGSNQFTFRFNLLAKSELKVDSVHCDLPLAKHYKENTVLVSNKTGKKSNTTFKLITSSGPYQLWEAQTNFIRMHQIRVHAMESGIRILGEELYTHALSPRSVAFKALSTKKSDRKLMSDDLYLHLSSVQWNQEGKSIVVNSPLPPKITNLLETSKHI